MSRMTYWVNPVNQAAITVKTLMPSRQLTAFEHMINWHNSRVSDWLRRTHTTLFCRLHRESVTSLNWDDDMCADVCGRSAEVGRTDTSRCCKHLNVTTEYCALVSSKTKRVLDSSETVIINDSCFSNQVNDPGYLWAAHTNALTTNKRQPDGDDVLMQQRSS